MEYFNDKWLPDYVFTKKFDKFLFNFHPEFFGIADLFLEDYISILKQLGKDRFEVWEVVAKSNEVKFLREYDINKLDSAPIYNDPFRGDMDFKVVPGFSYLCDLAGRIYLTVSGNAICVYLERDLEAVIIACSEEISKVFLSKKNELEILTLEEYITLLGQLHSRDIEKQWFIDAKSKLLENYKSTCGDHLG